MDPGHSSYFLAVPAVLVILLNIVCLVTVIRVVRNKLIFENSFNRNNDIAAKSAKASCSKAKAKTKCLVGYSVNTAVNVNSYTRFIVFAIELRGLQAVLILVPVFGLHFLLLPVRPRTGSQLEYCYEVSSAIMP